MGFWQFLVIKQHKILINLIETKGFLKVFPCFSLRFLMAHLPSMLSASLVASIRPHDLFEQGRAFSHLVTSDLNMVLRAKNRANRGVFNRFHPLLDLCGHPKMIQRRSSLGA